MQGQQSRCGTRRLPSEKQAGSGSTIPASAGHSCRPAILLLLIVCVLCAPTTGIATTGADAGAPDVLTVATVERKPFAMTVDGQLTGFSIELWEALASRLGWTYEFRALPAFADMLGQVRDGDVDLAIGNISITAERESSLDFSHAIFDAGLQILIPTDGASTGVLAAIFTWQTLAWVGVAVLVIFVIANLMWLFERSESPYFQRGYREGLWPSFWYAMHVMISGGFEEHVPRSIPARLLGIALVVSSLFLVSAFVAQIASTMTVNELRADIETVQDLYGKRVGTTRGSTAAAFLARRSIDHSAYDSLDDLLGDVRAGRLDAVVHDSPVLRYFAATDGRGTTRVVGPVFKPEKYGIAFVQGSERVEPVNRVLLELRENGSYDEIYRRWFGATAGDG